MFPQKKLGCVSIWQCYHSGRDPRCVAQRGLQFLTQSGLVWVLSVRQWLTLGFSTTMVELWVRCLQD